MDDEIVVSTDLVERAHRAEFWREMARPIYEARFLPEDRDLPFAGSVRSRRVGPLLVAATAFSRHEFLRDRRIIARGELDGFLVQLVTSGTMRGDFNGVDVAVRAGDICLVDLAQAFRCRVEAGARIMTSLPHAQVETLARRRNLHGIVLKADRPIVQLLAVYLTGLRSLEAQLSGMQSEAMLEALAALLAGALNDEVPDETADLHPVAAALRRRTFDFIAQHAHLPELSPDYIARRLNVSRSHLYRAFSRDGGVASAVRDKRLDAALLELTRTTPSHRSIAGLAHGLGFSSANQFLRAFRGRFGMTPSEARAEKSALLAEDAAFTDLHGHFAGLHRRTTP